MIGFRISQMHGFRSWWDRSTDAASPCDVVAEIAYLEQGGAIVTLRGRLAEAIFDLGPIEVSEAAIRMMETSGHHAWPLLLRHVQGDWGEFGQLRTANTRDPAAHNHEAIRTNEGRVVSEFATAGGGRLWIITHLGEGGYTTFLVSESPGHRSAAVIR